MSNIFDALYEVPDMDEHLEPVFDVDPYIYYEIDLEYAQGEL